MSVFWRSGRCTVWVAYSDSGAVVFTGVDRGYFGDGDYEYAITVSPEEFPAVRAGLGCDDPNRDIVELLCLRVAAMMPRGERSWLDEHGIDYRFSTL